MTVFVCISFFCGEEMAGWQLPSQGMLLGQTPYRCWRKQVSSSISLAPAKRTDSHFCRRVVAVAPCALTTPPPPTNSPKPSKCAGSFTDTGAMRVHDLSTTVATAIMTLDEKRCLEKVMTDPKVTDQIASIAQLREDVIDLPDPQASQRMKSAFDRLSSWQEALVAMG